MSELTVSEKGIKLIKGFEKCRLTAYNDGYDKYTIGWGMTFYPDGTKVKKGDKITQEQAESMFDWHKKRVERKVNARLIAPSQNMFDAATCFCFNAGTGWKDKREVYHEFQLWDKINKQDADLENYWHTLCITSAGKPSSGLVRRRKAEYHLAATGEINFFDK